MKSASNGRMSRRMGAETAKGTRGRTGLDTVAFIHTHPELVIHLMWWWVGGVLTAVRRDDACDGVRDALQSVEKLHLGSPTVRVWHIAALVLGIHVRLAGGLVER